MTEFALSARPSFIRLANALRSIQARLVLAYALMVVPSIYLLHGLVESRNAELAFLRSEMSGLGFIADLRGVLQQLGQAADDQAPEGLRRDLSSALLRHESEFEALGIGKVGRAALARMIEGRIASVSELEARLSHLILEVSDSSKLNLDPELPSFKTVELSIEVIPPLMERIAQFVRLDSGQNPFAGYDLPEPVRTTRSIAAAGAIALLLDRLRSAAEAAGHQIDSGQIISADASVRRCVSASVAATVALPSDRALCVDALQALTTIAHIADSTLARMFDQRMLRIEWTFWPIVISAGLSAILSLAFFLVAVRGRIVKPLLAMTEAMSRVAAGDLSAPIEPLRRQDELGAMSAALEVFRASMAEREQSRMLAAQRDAAEAASRFKSTFVANISHELRTPLNAIIGYSELMLEDDEPVDAAEVLDVAKRIHDSAIHLQALINDVLDLSKIEAGRMTLEIEPFTVGDLLASIEPIVQPLASRNGNRLQLAIADPALAVLGDALRIRQIVINLLSNACKFTKNGTVVLAVTRIAASGQPMVRFEVRDTGIGMTPEAQERLFRPFTQADGTIARRFGGTGLGLSIAFHLSTLMGGTIRVASVVDEGSVFTVDLPLAPAQGGPPPQAAAAPQPTRAVPLPPAGLHHPS